MDDESRFLQSLIFYNQACGVKDLEQDSKKIKKVAKIKGDIPFALLGLLRELSFTKPPGCFQTIFPIFVAQAQDAQAGVIGLLGKGF